jgi:hypothetical protein
VAHRSKVGIIAAALILIQSASAHADFWSQLDPFNSNGVVGGFFHPHFHEPGSDLPDVPPPPPGVYQVTFSSSSNNGGPLIFFTHAAGHAGWNEHVLYPGKAVAFHFNGAPEVGFPDGVGNTQYHLVPGSHNTFIWANGKLHLVRTK